MVDISHIKKVTMIGAGNQGCSIGQIALMAGFEKVILNDLNMDILQKAADIIENGFPVNDEDLGLTSYGLKSLEENGFLKEGQTCENLLNRLVLEVDLRKAVNDVNYIIEAVPEFMDIKQNVYQQLGEFTKERAIIASNTSTMSISKLGEASGKPEYVHGMHFFGPITGRMVEVTKGEKTKKEVMDIGEAIAYNLPCIGGKRVVARLEKETPGFIGNRINIVGILYLNWIAEQAVKKNIPYEQLDADVLGVMNPPGFVLLDIIGLDVIYGALKYFEETVSSDFKPSKIITDMMESGNLGRKTGKGFYDWTSGVIPDIDASKKANIINPEIVLALQLNEGCRLLEQGIVNNYKIIDQVNLLAYRNPGPFIPGKKNYERWSILLEEFAEKSGYEYVKPCKLMKSGEFRKMRK